MVTAIAAIDRFKGNWQALKHLKPEVLGALKRVATIESVGSSTRIEGARLSDAEVAELLSRVRARSFSSRDEQEVAGYAETMELVFSSFADIPLTENHVRQLHRDLLRHSEKDARHRGSYKTLPNHVEAFAADGTSIGVVFETASPFDTPRLMGDLVAWTGAALGEGRLHPLLTIALFTVRFLAIHPFQDGNGRLSRILTTLLMLRAGYEYVPYSSLERIVEENKDRYYLALRAAQTRPATGTTAWIDFFLAALSRQKERLEAKLERERALLALPPLAAEILQLAAGRGSISIAEIETLTGANRNTIKLRLRELVRDGQVALRGKGRAARYTLP
jgi:Fic family protein